MSTVEKRKHAMRVIRQVLSYGGYVLFTAMGSEGQMHLVIKNHTRVPAWLQDEVFANGTEIYQAIMLGVTECE